MGSEIWQREELVLHKSNDRLFFSYVVAHQNIHQTDVRMDREIQGSNRLVLFCACRLRQAPLAIKFVTNTTKESKSNLLARLQRLHFDVQVECQRATFENKR